MAETSSGNSTYFKYEAVENIMDQMSNIVNDMKTQIETVREITNERDNIWRGVAADKFWSSLLNGLDDANLEYIEEITTTDFPATIEAVRKLIVQNKSIDSQLISNNDIDANKANDNVQANSATTNAQGVDKALNDSVGLDAEIFSVDANTEAKGVNTALNDSVGLDAKISSVDANTEAKGVNTALNDSVGLNAEITSNSKTTGAEGIDTSLINGVGVDAEIKSNSETTGAQGVDTALNESIGVDAEIKSNSETTGAQGVNTDLNESVGIEGKIGSQANENQLEDDIFSNIVKNYQDAINIE